MTPRRKISLKPVMLSIATILTSSVVISACQSTECKHVLRSSFPTGEAATQVDKSLLTGEPCTLPCWYRLIPGESTEEDALKVLQDLPFVDKASIRTQARDAFPGEMLIHWTSLTSDQEGSGTGTVAINGKGKVLFMNYNPEYPLTLGKLVELFDGPDKVFVLYQGYHCFDVRFIWFKYGLVAGITVGKDRQITHEMFAENVGYFAPISSPTEYLQISHLSEDYLNSFQEWEGFEAIKISP